MTADGMQRMSWSMTQRLSPGDLRGEHAFEDLVEACRDLCVRYFPQEQGYDPARHDLSGPLQGSRFTATRGRLRLLLSVQRFERGHIAAPDGKRSVEIRVVASMDLKAPTRSPQLQRTAAVWGLASCAMGTLGVSALALGSAGLLSAGVQAALLVPALITWRTCATIGIARSMRRQVALGAARVTAAQHTLADALPRWQQLAPALAAERERVGERLGVLPFRNPAHAPRRVAARRTA